MTRDEQKKKKLASEIEAAYNLGIRFAATARTGLNTEQVRFNGLNQLAAAGLYAKANRDLFLGNFELGYDAERQRLNPPAGESDVDEITRMRPPAPPLGFRQGMAR